MAAIVLVIDNFDSFTYNLVQILEVAGAEVVVRRNDAITVAEALDLAPTHLLVSPGPGRPEGAGISMAMIEAMLPRIPVLGVCLGHQALGAVLGARIVPARALMHGKASAIHHDGRTVFEGLPNPFTGGRYHSLAVAEAGLPGELEISARTPDGEIMGLRHRRFPVDGVQFHPESILSPGGDRLVTNFLGIAPRSRHLPDLRHTAG